MSICAMTFTGYQTVGFVLRFTSCPLEGGGVYKSALKIRTSPFFAAPIIPVYWTSLSMVFFVRGLARSIGSKTAGIR